MIYIAFGGVVIVDFYFVSNPSATPPSKEELFNFSYCELPNKKIYKLTIDLTIIVYVTCSKCWALSKNFFLTVLCISSSQTILLFFLSSIISKLKFEPHHWNFNKPSIFLRRIFCACWRSKKVGIFSKSLSRPTYATGPCAKREGEQQLDRKSTLQWENALTYKSFSSPKWRFFNGTFGIW